MRLLLWFAAALMLTSAVLLVVDVGAPFLWIAIIAVGLGLVVFARRGMGPAPRH